MKYLLLLLILIPTGIAQGRSFPCADSYNAICGAPVIEDVCWSVTSYWPFQLRDKETWDKIDFYALSYDEIVDGIEAGKWGWLAVPFGGQADGNPTLTGDGTVIDPYTANWSLVAGPIETYWRTFEFPWGAQLVQHDTFGVPAYQDGVFWHHGYKQLVIGVDILSFEPVHYLECDGVIN